MSAFEVHGDGAAHGKPCHGCRKRKVKCDKTRPCSNCTRSKQLCTYESFDTEASETQTVAASANGDVHERLARLEALMATMMVRDGVSVPSEEPKDRAGNAKPRISPPSSIHTLELIKSKPNTTTNGAPVGQIVFQDGHSAYFDSDFWPGLITEIEDLRRLFDPTGVPNQASEWVSGSIFGYNVATPSSVTDLSSFHPAIEQSNALCKLFFESVNPFIRVLHQSHFGKELSQYRRGTYEFPREFESLLFSVYALTVNSIHSEEVERIFSLSKQMVLAQFQKAAQIALTHVNLHKTDKIITLQATLHYLTLLFQQNAYQDAIALLGIAVRIAQTFGSHRDPSHFPYSPWVCGIRRRIWNHICCLNSLALSSYGTESCLPATSDAAPPQNANDSDWHASRFSKPGSSPPDFPGFKEMTFVLVNREIADLTVELSKLQPDDFEARRKLIRHAEQKIYAKYLNNTDRGNPSQTIVLALVEVRLSGLRLAISHRQSTQARPDSRDVEKYQTAISAINLLEAIEYHCNTFSPHNWDWVFTSVVPWLPTSILLTQLPLLTRKLDIDRAQKQIDKVFERYSDPFNPLTMTPMWLLLVQLRQHMQAGSDTNHSYPHTAEASPGIDQRTLAFNDDLMLDFSQIQPHQVISDDSLSYQEMQDLPWLTTSAPY